MIYALSSKVEAMAFRSLVARTASFLRDRDAAHELFRRLFLWIVSAGPIPEHIAIIMDGNRRYATKRKMKKSQGHQFGYDTLMHLLRDCYELGIRYVTVYAFSIENFRRSEEEVDMLMNLMHEKLEALIQKESMVNQYGIRVQVLGDLSLLPDNVRKSADRAMEFSKNNDKAVLNICAPYTATQEIVNAVEEVLTAKTYEDNEKAIAEMITVEEIGRHLYTWNCPEPELLIRTSGETRLSNYLLWQTSFSLLYATPVLWPEFSFRHLIIAILKYQKDYAFLQQKRGVQIQGTFHEHHD